MGKPYTILWYLLYPVRKNRQYSRTRTRQRNWVIERNHQWRQEGLESCTKRNFKWNKNDQQLINGLKPTLRRRVDSNSYGLIHSSQKTSRVTNQSCRASWFRLINICESWLSGSWRTIVFHCSLNLELAQWKLLLPQDAAAKILVFSKTMNNKLHPSKTDADIEHARTSAPTPYRIKYPMHTKISKTNSGTTVKSCSSRWRLLDVISRAFS